MHKYGFVIAFGEREQLGLYVEATDYYSAEEKYNAFNISGIQKTPLEYIEPRQYNDYVDYVELNAFLRLAKTIQEIKK